MTIAYRSSGRLFTARANAAPPAELNIGRANQQQKVVFVSASVYWLVWWLVVSTHSITAAFVLSLAFGHLVLSLPAVHSSTSALRIPLALKQVTAASYLMIAISHLLAVKRLLQVSMQHGRLTLKDDAMQPHSISTASSRTTPATVSANGRRMRANRIRYWYRRFATLWEIVFGTEGYLGISGPLFTTFLVYRELVEISLQSYQLWSLSFNVSRPWINTFAVSAVVVNCFSLPIVNFVASKRETTRRLVHLVVDMYLDFSCTVLVAVCVLAPYFAEFDWATSGYRLRLVLDDVWMANAQAEARQVLVTSFPDFLSSLLPQYSIFGCLHVLKRMVFRCPQPHQIIPRRTIAIAPLVADSAAKNVPPLQNAVADLSLMETVETVETVEAVNTVETESRSVRIVRACMALWGVVLIALHIKTLVFTSTMQIAGCQDYVRPWFVSQVPCSVLYVDCYRREIDGSAEEVGAVLVAVERSVLKKLVFLHCPVLEIPTDVANFHELGALELYNVTLADWPTSAAIREATHPAMTTIYFGKSNISTIPAGLLHPNLPTSLTAVGFYNCSIASLPHDLGDIWANSRIKRLGFESTKLRSVPASIGRLPLQKLWMTDSLIEKFPDGMFEHNSKLESIRLSGNPLLRLPDRIGGTTQLTELIVEYTNTATLPSWAVEWLETHTKTNHQPPAHSSFYASPVCAPTNGALTEAIKRAVCARDWESKFGFVPYELVRAKYAL